MNKLTIANIILASMGLATPEVCAQLAEQGYLDKLGVMTWRGWRVLRTAKRRVRRERESAVREVSRKANGVLRAKRKGPTVKQVDVRWRKVPHALAKQRMNSERGQDARWRRMSSPRMSSR